MQGATGIELRLCAKANFYFFFTIGTVQVVFWGELVEAAVQDGGRCHVLMRLRVLSVKKILNKLLLILETNNLYKRPVSSFDFPSGEKRLIIENRATYQIILSPRVCIFVCYYNSELAERLSLRGAHYFLLYICILTKRA